LIVILAANGRPAAEYALWELEDALKQEGTEMLLSIRRGGKSTSKRLTLRSLL
jgi:hypothetical protein